MAEYLLIVVFLFLRWVGSENLMDCRYNVMLTILTYFLPICAMGYAYFQVGVELWGSQGIGECTDHQMENVRSKRRVIIISLNIPPYLVFILITYSPSPPQQK